MPEPKEIPAEAFTALASLKNSLGGDLSKYKFGIGLKTKGDEVLDEIVLVVYVPKKLPPEEIPPSERVPLEHEHYQTDVVELRYIPIADTGHYDPLRGGIEISPIGVAMSSMELKVEQGTLGCIVRHRSDGKELLLTCEHVASHSDDNGVNLHDALGQKIFQPSDGESTASIIGECIAADDDLDAALILPNFSRNLIHTVEDIGQIRGRNTLKLWDRVSKRGRTTGLTEGRVLRVREGQSGILQDFEFVGFPIPFQIVDYGDSGSVVLNSQQEVVGLLKAKTDEKGPTNGIATLIDPILDKFQVDIAVTPIISSITPDSAIIAALEPVVIEGVGFEPPNQVFFGNVPTAVLSQNPTRLEVFPPPRLVSTTVDVRISNKWGDSSSPGPAAVFRYLPIV